MNTYQARTDEVGAGRRLQTNPGGRAASPDRAERQTLASDLLGALGRGEFVLHYQPRVNLRSGRTDCVEALLRWHHPRLGLLQAQEFIEVAERLDTAGALGKWVLTQAVEQAKKWARTGAPMRVAVNVSGLQIEACGFATVVREAIAGCALAPETIELELTETKPVTDSVQALRNCRQLAALGVQLALDDFGEGFAEIKTLDWYPAKVIKIDKRYIARIAIDQAQFSLVNAMSSFAHALGAIVVAEGIENASQEKLLASIGVDQGQGYLFGRAVPADRLRIPAQGCHTAAKAVCSARERRSLFAVAAIG